MDIKNEFKDILLLTELYIANGILFSYYGDVNKKMGHQIALLCKEKMIEIKADDLTQRRVFAIVDELLDNVMTHSENGKCVFILSFANNLYKINSSNVINKTNLERLNSLSIITNKKPSKDEISSIYKEKMKLKLQGNNAGLGILTTLKKSDTVTISFTKKDETYLFNLEATIIVKEVSQVS